MKKAITLKPFEDLVEGVSRVPGDTFNANDERADYLAGLGLVRTEMVSKAKKAKKEV